MAKSRVKTVVSIVVALCAIAALIALIMPRVFAGGDGGVAEGAAASASVSTSTSSSAPADVGSGSQTASSTSYTATASVSSSAASVSTGEREYEQGTLLVNLVDGASAGDLLAAFAGTLLANAAVDRQADDYVKLSLPEGVEVAEAVEFARATGLVANAQPNYVYHLLEQGRDPLAATASSVVGRLVAGTALGDALDGSSAVTVDDPLYNEQWSLPSVNAPEAWAEAERLAGGAAKVCVAVLDAGFLPSHEDLAANVVNTYSAADGGTIVSGGRYNRWVVGENVSHGTHVAGIVSAVANNAVGVAGVTDNRCNLMLVRVSRKSNGDMTTDILVDAYNYLVAQASAYNVRVVNMSLGGGVDETVTRATDPEFYDAIARARQAGILTVAAASNQDNDYKPPFNSIPGDFDNVVGVINLAQADNADGVVRDSSSNYNIAGQTANNISAPGTDILSTSAGAFGIATSAYESLDGTSMASPLVAGIAGLLFSIDPQLTASQVEQIIYRSAKDLTAAPASAGWDRYTGYGEIDALAAVKIVESQNFIERCGVVAPSVTYTGSALEPKVSVVNGATTLVEGVDYTVSYANNVNAGTATFTVTGIGSYIGSAEGSFTIEKAPLVKATLKTKSAKWNKKKHKPKVKSVRITSGAVSASEYKVAYYRGNKKTTNFKKPGIIKVKITGQNNCRGTITKTFKIKKRQ